MRLVALAGAVAGLVLALSPAAYASPPPGQAPCAPAGICTPAPLSGVTTSVTPACSDPLTWTLEACPGVPAPTLAPYATPTATATAGGGGGLLGGITNFLKSAVDPIAWINHVVSAAARPIFEAFGTIVFKTPDLLGNDAVKRMWFTLLAITDVCLLLVVVWRAHQVTWGGLREQVSAKKGMERLVVGVAAAHLNLLVLGFIGPAANELTLALLKVGGDNLQVRIDSLIPLVVGGVVNPLQTLVMLAVLVTGALVVFWSLVRWVVLAMVTAIGAPANMAMAVDQEQLTRVWWRCEFILLFTPVAQVIAYDLCIWLFFSTNSLLPGPSDFLKALAVLLLMWLLYRIPKMALHAAAGPLMEAGNAARGKLKLGLGLAALGVGAATGISVAGIAGKGFSLHGLARGLLGGQARKAAALRKKRMHAGKAAGKAPAGKTSASAPARAGKAPAGRP